MNYLKLLTPLLLTLPTLAFAQLQVLNSSAQSARARVDLAAGEFMSIPISPVVGAKISNLQVAIENGDIIFSYQLANLEKDQFFEIVPVIKLDDRQLLLATDEFRGDVGRSVIPGTKRLVWLNPLERYVNLTGQLEVTLTANEWGEPDLPYDCTLGEPTFTSKQKRPYLLAAGVGAASIGLGQLFRKQKEDAYRGYLDSGTLAEAQPKYEDANSKNHTYLILTWAGAGVLAADAVLFLIRNGKYKRDLKNYNLYCKPQTIGFQPVLELPDGRNTPNGQVGFKMRVALTGSR